jgi:hypothetical protein
LHYHRRQSRGTAVVSRPWRCDSAPCAMTTVATIVVLHSANKRWLVEGRRRDRLDRAAVGYMCGKSKEAVEALKEQGSESRVTWSVLVSDLDGVGMCRGVTSEVDR